MPSAQIALLFPPFWYFDAVPADLSYPAGALREAGVEAWVRDLSAAALARSLGPARARWRDGSTYRAPEAQAAALAALADQAAQVSAAFGLRLGLRRWAFPLVDEASVPAALRLGLDPSRNPALPVLTEAAEEAVARGVKVVAIALVHPDQRVAALALGRRLRQAGFRGTLALYGSYEDVLSPLDLADDLVGHHLLWEDFDGVILGESESALVALAQGREPPNWLAAGATQRPSRFVEDLATLPTPDFRWVRPEDYATPEVVVDLRLGRGCPWGRCAFCAIQSHQRGYRAGPAAALGRAARQAAEQLSTPWVRVRDDLLTPPQLEATAAVFGPLGVRWTARARFSPALTGATLRAAARGGLDELWMGLESAVPRIRERMDKGVAQDVVERNLREVAQAGVHLRALCLLGFPGESEEEARATLRFLTEKEALVPSFSLTPFQAMRRSPLADAPERYGLRPAADPLPRWERLRHELPLEPGGRLPRARLDQLVAEDEGLNRRLATFARGPTAVQEWLGRAARSPRGAPPGLAAGFSGTGYCSAGGSG